MNKLPPGSSSVVYHDLPIAQYSGWDKVRQIEGMLLEHDNGQLSRSAIFADSMTRDDRISGVLETRTGSLLASPVECREADDSAQARALCIEIGGDQDAQRPGLWQTIFPTSVQSGLLHWANIIGIGLAEIVWDTKAKDSKGRPRYTPRLKLWHPQFLYWDWMVFRWMLIAREGVVTLPDTDDEVHSDGKWVIYAPHGYKYGWLRGLVRPLAYKFMMRGWNYRDWARYNERHGQPIIGVITPPKADEDIKDELMDSVVSGGADAVVALPQDSAPGGEKYDIKLIEAVGRSFDSFNLFKGQLDTDIAIAVLGQNLTTEVKGGSRAAAEIQNQVRIDKRRQDSGLANVFRDQVLYWDAAVNANDPALAPIPIYQVEPPEDETEQGAALKAYGDGVAALVAAAQAGGETGLVAVREMYELQGIPTHTPAEVAAAKAVALEEQQAQMKAMGGGPGGAPGGGGGFGGAGRQPPKPGQPAGGARPGANDGKPKKLSELGDPAPASVTPVKTVAFQGMTIAIENPAGTVREWRDENGVTGQTTMQNDYGFIVGAMGADKDELDAYLGPDENAPDVHIVHQWKKPDYDTYDEDKVFLGFPDAGAAKAAFVAHRDDGAAAFKGMSTVPLDEFKRKLRTRVGTGPIRAASENRLAEHFETTKALIALLKRAPTAKPKTPAGKRRVLRHVDRIEANAVQLAARALAGDLAGLKHEIDQASDFEDLKKRIIHRYKGMRPDQLADILRRANLMAHMSGRVAALQEI